MMRSARRWHTMPSSMNLTLPTRTLILSLMVLLSQSTMPTTLSSLHHPSRGRISSANVVYGNGAPSRVEATCGSIGATVSFDSIEGVLDWNNMLIEPWGNEWTRYDRDKWTQIFVLVSNRIDVEHTIVLSFWNQRNLLQGVLSTLLVLQYLSTFTTLLSITFREP